MQRESPTRRPEDARESSLRRILPQPLARATAIEWTIVTSAFDAFRHVWNAQTYHATTYVETAKLRLLVFAMPIILVPDLVFVHLVLARAPFALKLGLDVLGIYAVLWVLGAFPTMASRPHELDGDLIRLHRGIFKIAEIPRAAIENVRVLERRGRKRSAEKDVAVLSVGGVPDVEIALSTPVTVRGSGLAQSIRVKKVVVGSDRPSDLVAALTRSR